MFLFFYTVVLKNKYLSLKSNLLHASVTQLHSLRKWAVAETRAGSPARRFPLMMREEQRMEERTARCAGTTCNPWPLYSATQQSEMHGCMKNRALPHIIFDCFQRARRTVTGPCFHYLLCIRAASAHPSYVMCTVRGGGGHTHLFCFPMTLNANHDKLPEFRLPVNWHTMASASHGCLCHVYFSQFKKRTIYLPAPLPCCRKTPASPTKKNIR